jgi:BirA family biotin operon repressor/biotin-[acetyl-CoA-carboxylase] ligase
MKLIPSEIIYLQDVDSTNNYAAKWIQDNGLRDGTVILAQNQQNGRGQKGTSWQADSGKNLTLSVILSVKQFKATEQFQLSKAVAVALQKFLSKILLKKKVEIKWPNDILVDGKKIAGVLIETSIQGSSLNSAVVGIGLNVNQESFSSGVNGTSLMLETGVELELDDVFKNLLAYLNAEYILLNSKSKSVNANYLSRLYLKNVEANFIIEGVKMKAKILGVSNLGKLVFKTSDRQIECDLKEVVYM